jgi:hypothetical protein
MQLVRLATDDADGKFDLLLQEDVDIKANSTVALQSLSCVPQRDALDVDGQNDDVAFTMTGTGGDRVATLDVGTYDSGSAGTLLSNIQARMNSVFDVLVGADIGQQWQISENARKHIVFARRQAQLVDPSSGVSAAVQNATVGAGAAREWSRSGGTLTFLDSFVGGGGTWNSGGAVFRGRIGKLGSVAGQGDVILGVGTVNPLTIKASVYDFADILLGIRFTNTAAAFRVVSRGVDTLNAAAPQYSGPNSAQNSVLQISHTGFRELSASVWLPNGNNLVLQTVGNVVPETKLYPLVLFVGDASSTITLLRSVVDPWATAAVSGAPDPEDHHTSLSVTPQYSLPTLNNTLRFESQTLATWLGFQDLQYGPVSSLADRSVNFESENQPLSSSLIDSVIVESLTLDIRSYNASWNPARQSGRSSILAVLTPDAPSRASGTPLVFTSPYPTFLSLRNARPQTLRRLRFRLLRSDLTPLRLEGEAVLTILIAG